MQARIADKTADMGFKQIILITVFYSLVERLCITIPKNLVLTIFFFSKIMCASLCSSVCMYEWALRIPAYIAGRVF